MRKFMLTLAVTLMAAIWLVPAQVSAATSTTEQQLLVKKKKAAEAKKKEAEAKKQAEARKLAGKKKKQAEARKKASQKKLASADRCNGFLRCVFGKPRAGVQRAAFGASKKRVADRPTADDITWSEGSKYPAGTLVVNTPERNLYLVLGDGKARRYRVGVGREGFQWSGNSKIAAKAEWPSWTPPKAMIQREAAKGNYIPEFMEGGPENPLGARALYIGGTLYRIHGTNNAASIGGAVSSGCIRMMNSDVIDLYDRVRIGTRIYVYQ